MNRRQASPLYSTSYMNVGYIQYTPKFAESLRQDKCLVYTVWYLMYINHWIHSGKHLVFGKIWDGNRHIPQRDTANLPSLNFHLTYSEARRTILANPPLLPIGRRLNLDFSRWKLIVVDTASCNRALNRSSDRPLRRMRLLFLAKVLPLRLVTRLQRYQSCRDIVPVKD